MTTCARRPPHREITDDSIRRFRNPGNVTWGVNESRQLATPLLMSAFHELPEIEAIAACAAPRTTPSIPAWERHWRDSLPHSQDFARCSGGLRCSGRQGPLTESQPMRFPYLGEGRVLAPAGAKEIHGRPALGDGVCCAMGNFGGGTPASAAFRTCLPRTDLACACNSFQSS
jgi:hypothetical protein